MPVPDGMSAVDAGKHLRRYLLLIDINLPLMDGFQVLELLRAETGDVPAVLMTAEDKPETRARAAQLGVEQFVTKPCTTSFMLHAVEQALGQAAAHRRERLAYQRVSRSGGVCGL